MHTEIGGGLGDRELADKEVNEDRKVCMVRVKVTRSSVTKVKG